MNAKLAAWNAAPDAEAIEAMLACCGARRWAAAMVAARPIRSVEELSVITDRLWRTMEEADWIEAFSCHPRIGERKAVFASETSAAWSQQEQRSVKDAAGWVLAELADGNTRYEERFGFTYIVCASGKSAMEMLTILNRRLNNDRDAELREAAEQQRQIMQIRLGKWLIE